MKEATPLWYLGTTYPDFFSYDDKEGSMSLEQWSQCHHSTDEWLLVIEQVLDALDILEREQITHNDLHFGNILILRNGLTQFIDFGKAIYTYEPGRDLDQFLQGFAHVPLPILVRSLIFTLNK